MIARFSRFVLADKVCDTVDRGYYWKIIATHDASCFRWENIGQRGTRCYKKAKERGSLWQDLLP